MGWQWHQLDHMQIICTLLRTDNHASTSSLNFKRRMLFRTPNQQCQSAERNYTACGNYEYPAVWLTSWIPARPKILLLLLAGSLPAGIYAGALLLFSQCYSLFSRVTLTRKQQSTSDLDHFHARHLPCSCVKSRDDPISDCRVDSAVPYSFICRFMTDDETPEEKPCIVCVRCRVRQSDSSPQRGGDLFSFSRTAMDLGRYDA